MRSLPGSRILGACAGRPTCTVNTSVSLLAPGTAYEDRLQQLDLRFARRFTVGGFSVWANADVANVFNRAEIYSANTGFGPNWLVPYEVGGGRVVRLSGQLDFDRLARQVNDAPFARRSGRGERLRKGITMMKRVAAGRTAVIFAVWMSAMAVAAGQGGPAVSPQMAETVFKNVQLLKGLPVDQFMGTMGVFSASTGLNCTDCHVEESGSDWARYADDNARKQTTRRMMQMVDALNTTSFGGRQVVTCYTCHRGFARPSQMASIDQLYGSPPPPEPGDLIGPARGQPSADEILATYFTALGGLDRLNALTSLSATGTYLGFDDVEKSPMELYARAPAQRTIITRPASGDFTWVYDGRSGWLAAPLTDRPLPVTPVTGQELEGLAVEVQLLFPARLKETLGNWRVGFPTEIGDREVNVVQGTTPTGGAVTLCFDRETGLLTRLVRYASSPVGRIVTRVDYADYRDVAGVKMPFQWTVSWLNGRSVFELESVRPNVAVDASRFGPPAPGAARR